MQKSLNRNRKKNTKVSLIKVFYFIYFGESLGNFKNEEYREKNTFGMQEREYRTRLLISIHKKMHLFVKIFL